MAIHYKVLSDSFKLKGGVFFLLSALGGSFQSSGWKFFHPVAPGIEKCLGGKRTDGGKWVIFTSTPPSK